jgi:ABC-type methionine transport system ATPase subunit
MLLLEKINSLGTTVLVVTHEKELVNEFGKRVVAIDGGQVVSDRTGGYYGQQDLERAMAKMEHPVQAKQEPKRAQWAALETEETEGTGLEIPGFMRSRSKEQEERTDG